MHKNYSAGSIFIGKDRFMVTVYPNTDYAFIVALFIILDAINSQKKRSSNGALLIYLFIIYFLIFVCSHLYSITLSAD